MSIIADAPVTFAGVSMGITAREFVLQDIAYHASKVVEFMAEGAPASARLFLELLLDDVKTGAAIGLTIEEMDAAKNG